jgi:hypothetical protein
MNADIFAEWMRRQGRQVIRTRSSYWYSAGPHALQAFPYHWLISPSQEEIQGLMQAHGVISLRYSTLLNSSTGKVSYHIILHNPFRLDMLEAEACNSVKHGLRSCKVEQISFQRLATEGWSLQRDTLDRQNRLRSMTQATWECICRSAAVLPGFEAWAAVSGGELAAALITCQIDNTWCVPYELSHRRFLNDRVNHALLYRVSTNLLARENVEGIFFTVQSLDAPITADDVKLRMGLIAKPVRQRVEFHRWLQPVATPTTHRLFRHLLQQDSGNHLIAKTEGMLRFYLEGKQPLTHQDWPQCLMPCEEKLPNSMGG